MKNHPNKKHLTLDPKGMKKIIKNPNPLAKSSNLEKKSSKNIANTEGNVNIFRSPIMNSSNKLVTQPSSYHKSNTKADLPLIKTKSYDPENGKLLINNPAKGYYFLNDLSKNEFSLKRRVTDDIHKLHNKNYINCSSQNDNDDNKILSSQIMHTQENASTRSYGNKKNNINSNNYLNRKTSSNSNKEVVFKSNTNRLQDINYSLKNIETENTYFIRKQERKKKETIYAKTKIGNKLSNPSEANSEINPNKNNRNIITSFNHPTFSNKKVTKLSSPKNEIENNSKAIKINNNDKVLMEKIVFPECKQNANHYEFSLDGREDNGKSKINQDSFIYFEEPFKLNEDKKFYLFGVMDGHGTNGHHISKHVVDEIKKYFSNKDNFVKQGKEITSKILYDRLAAKNYNFFNIFFNKLNDELLDYEYDNHFSGTTLVMILLLNQKIMCINIGDSRAILISHNDLDDTFSLKLMSYDHKPDLPSEKERIISKGGVVSPCEEDMDTPDKVMRVWIKNEKYPGIAISRTIGDQIAKSVGVSCTPDIIEENIDENTAFIILGSDGLYEFLTNEEIMNIAIPFYKKNDPKGAVQAIINESAGLWRKEGEGRDDITCITYFLHKYKKNNSK